MQYNHRLHHTISFIICLFILNACSVSRYRYLHTDDKNSDISDTLISSPTEYTIQFNDLVYVKFFSILEESVELFNKQNNSLIQNRFNGSASELGYEWMGYRVNEMGYIELPVIGRIKVVGNTINQLKTVTDSCINLFVEDAFSEVKLLSFNIEMMGEFNSPGRINTLGKSLNLMEAIDKAGGISYAGNWRKIYIIRQLGNNKFTYELDITDRNLMGTDKYYLMPHDIVYVEPRVMSAARINISDFTLLLSTITTTLTTVLLIVSLNR